MPKVKINPMPLHENRYTRDDNSWDVVSLIEYVKDKKYEVFDLPLAGIDLGFMPFDVKDIKQFIFQVERLNKTNLDYPILLDDSGFVCDGWHRVAKAILEGRETIKAIRIEQMPEASNSLKA